MKKLTFLLLILPFATVVSAQKIIKMEKATSHSIHVFGNNFEGVIFTKKYHSNGRLDQKSKGFTPTSDEIALAEKVLDNSLDTLKDNDGQIAIIRKNIKKYFRQYWGFFDETGRKIIFINFLKKNSNEVRDKKSWLKDVIIPFHGGNQFWQIKVNLSTSELFDLGINGVA